MHFLQRLSNETFHMHFLDAQSNESFSNSQNSIKYYTLPRLCWKLSYLLVVDLLAGVQSRTLTIIFL